MNNIGKLSSIFVSFGLFLIAGCIIMLPRQGAAQPIGAWETAANGGGLGTDWMSTASIWLTNTGSGYVTPGGNIPNLSYPDTNTTPITLIPGAFVTNSAPLFINQMTISAGATFDANSTNTVIRNPTSTYDWDISGNLGLLGTAGSINLSNNAIVAVENGGTMTNFTTSSGDLFSFYGATNLYFLNGSLYVLTGSKVSTSGSTIPLATWSPNSTILYVPPAAGNKFPSQFTNQVFGNFIWNWPLQNGTCKPALDNNETIVGTFDIQNANTQIVENIPGQGFTLNVGNLLLTNVLFYPTASAGTVNINITGNFIVDYASNFKNNSGSASGNIAFDGTSPQFFAIYGTNGTASAWNWSIASGSTVDFGTNLSVNNGSAGAGAFTNSGWLDLEGYILNDHTNLSGNGVISNSVGSASVDGASGSYGGTIAGGTGLISVQKVGPPTWTLTGRNTYSGSTTVSAGTLALTGTASIADSTNILINGGATFDVSGLSSTFTLGAAQALGNNSSNTAAINGAVNVGSGTISLTYTSGTPAIVISGGNLNLASSTVFNVFNTGPALAIGTYTIITNSGVGAVTSASLPSVTVGGGGLSAGTAASLSLSNNYLNLVVAATAPPIPKITGISVSGTTLTLTAVNGLDGAQFILLGTTNLVSPVQWVPVLTNNFSGTGTLNLTTNVVNPAIPYEFYILQQ